MSDELTSASATFFSGGITVTSEETRMNVITPDYHKPVIIHVDEQSTVNQSVSNSINQTQTVSYDVRGPLHIYAHNIGPVEAGGYVITHTEWHAERVQPGAQVTSVEISCDTQTPGQWPVIPSNAVVQDASKYTEIIYHNAVVDVLAPPAPVFGGGDGGGEPLAQDFEFSSDCMVDTVGVFFESVDTAAGDVWCHLRPVEDGVPSTTILNKTTLSSKSIVASDDATVETQFKFSYPTYMERGKRYCFVIGGGSPNSRIWAARAGQAQIDKDNAIYEDTYSGVSFRSVNARSWTPEQAEDLKFRVMGPVFTESDMTLTFQAEVEREKLSHDPFEVEAGVKKARIQIDAHGLNTGDVVVVSSQEDVTFKVNCFEEPVPGQMVSSVNGQAIIHTVASQSANNYDVQLKNFTAYMRQGDALMFHAIDVKDGEGNVLRSVTDFNGIMTQAPYHEYNGVALAELNGELTVTDVDSLNSVIVDITSAPSISGRFGGTAVFAWPNVRYEIFNVSGDRETYTATESWSVLGMMHNVDDGPFESTNNTHDAGKVINLKTDYHMGMPFKVANKANEARVGLASTIVAASFSSPSKFISPVVNTNTFNMTVVTNLIQQEDQLAQDVAPNGAGRWVDETHASQGSGAYKYVTRKITLAKPASDVRVMFDVYKDIHADFDMYVRVREQYVNEDIHEYEWVKVNVTGKQNSVNLADMTDHELNIKEHTIGLPDSFIEFQFKITGETLNPAKPPLFKNFRAVAYT